MRNRAGILGTGSALPTNVLSNIDLEKMVDTSDEWIRSRTGIAERRIADVGESTSVYAVQACKRALEHADVLAEDVDLIVCATVTPDMMFPSTASLIQHQLGATHAAAFDLSAACSGFIYALSLASAYIENGRYRRILVVAADLLSKITDYEDRSTCVLFGDGAGAVLLGPVEDDKGFLAFDLGSDGSGAEYLSQPAGGSRMPATIESVESRLHYLHMAGPETFKFAVKAMVSSAERVLQVAGLERDDIDLLIPHQANIRIIEAARKRFGLTENQVMTTIEKYGNTSSSSMAIALDEAIREGRAHSGDLLVIVGFGGGLTWGATAVRLK